MALPQGITPKTVTFGPAVHFDGTVAEGTVTITAPENVVNTTTNAPLYSSQMSKRLVDGMASFSLCPTDAEGLNIKSWTYKINTVIQGALKQDDARWFSLPTAGPDTIDLDSLVTVPSSAGTPISATVVTSVNGQTGDVTVTGGGGIAGLAVVNEIPASPVTGTVYIVTGAGTTPPPADTTDPAAPVLTATAGNAQSVLTWTAATDDTAVTGYKVYKDSALLATLGNVLTYTATGLTNGTPVAFTVTALDAAGNESNPSNTQTVTPAAPASGGAVIASDDFTRADTTNGADVTNALGVTPVGDKAWVKEFGYAANINGNTALIVGPTGTSNTVAAIDAGVADVDVQTTLAGFSIPGGYPGLVARYASPTSFVYAGAGDWGNYGYAAGYGIEVGAQDNMGQTALGFYATTPAVGDVVRLVAKGTNYKLYVNGVLRVDVTSATPSTTATKVGLHARRADFDIKYDDFSVKTAP